MTGKKSDTDEGENEAFRAPVNRDIARKIRAQARGKTSVWFGFGLFGLVGWSIAVPALAGLALGIWLDGQNSGRVSWTLTCLIGGIVIGCFNAWHWVRREGSER